MDNYRSLKLSACGVRAFLGGSCILLDNVCAFLCEYKPHARMCFQGAGNMARNGSFGNGGLAVVGRVVVRTGQGMGEGEEA